MQYKCYVNTFKKQCKCWCKMLGIRQIQVLLSGTFWDFFFFSGSEVGWIHGCRNNDMKGL